MRRENDFYPTPRSIVDALVDELAQRWSPTGEDGEPHVWEPCCGDDRLADALKGKGFKVLSTDISRGQNFFDFDRFQGEVVVTNPPFRRIRQLIDHAFQIGVVQMALVCPERLWACQKGAEQFKRHQPSLWANLSWREDYLRKGRSPDRSLAVAIWDSPCAAHTHYKIWSRSAAK